MDARTLFLLLYTPAHGTSAPASPATTVLQGVSPEQMRTKLPQHNSVAWIMWHIARGEDWGVNAMLRGVEQVLDREQWNPKLGLTRRDFGAGMSEAEVIELSQKIDLEALASYFEAVTAETLRFLESFDFDELLEPLDVKARLASAPDALGPGSDLLRAVIERQTTKRWFLTTMALNDVRLHWTEAEHVLHLLNRDHPVP
jgi:hypothetical protein